jgi:hypothetical protein
VRRVKKPIRIAIEILTRLVHKVPLVPLQWLRDVMRPSLLSLK